MTPFPREEERRHMVERQIEARGIKNPEVLAAMREIPRHLFIPPPYDRSAYEDCPLPIRNGQTISQPYIVALMTDLLDPKPGDRMLEIGAGTGYQAAVLARIVRSVITIERLAPIAALARKNIADLGILNVDIIEGDGSFGYPPSAPYDGIIITAATPEIPKPLISQMAEGGRLVAPVGGREIQELEKLIRHGNSVERSFFGGVRFVPLIGEHGWSV